MRPTHVLDAGDAMIRSARTWDISMPITESMPVYPGDPPPGFTTSLADGVTLTIAHLSLHAGTHVDAPLHVFPDAPDAGQLPWMRLCGPACVVQALATPVDAEQVGCWPLRNRDRVLVRAAPGGCVFTADGARALLGRDIILLGVECLGPDNDDDPRLPVHRILLSASVPLLENLCLRDVRPGRYLLTCLGLPLPGREAAWVRAVLSC